MSDIGEKYTEFTSQRQTGHAGEGTPTAASAAEGSRRARAERARRAALLCLLLPLALAACSKRPQSPLGPLGESGALSTQAIQPAPSGATEGGQVGFFLDVSGSIGVRQLGPNGAQQPSAAGAPTGSTPPAGQSAPIPPRIGDPIYAPDSIQTGVDSTCRIQFGEGALVELTPRSRIEIPAFPKIAAGGVPPPPVVIVEGGIVLFSVARQASGDALLATTGSTVVATRGADFLVARLDARTEVAVGRGAVQVGLSRLPPGAPPLSPAAPGARAPAAGVETIIKDGVGPNPIDVRAGFEIAVPSATGKSPTAAGSTAGSASALTPRPLSAAYRALLFHNDRSVIPEEPLMKPQGGGAGEHGSGVNRQAGDAPATSSGSPGTGPSPSQSAPGAAVQAGPTPPSDPTAPSTPAAPSLRSAE